FEELTEFILKKGNWDNPRDWFDLELRDVFGIDVFAEPFDRARGYQIYENARARALVIRLEDLNRAAANALSEFLNIPDFKLVPANIGENKVYGALYKEYTNSLRLPQAYIDEAHSKDFIRHFYTEQELAASVARWVAPAA